MANTSNAIEQKSADRLAFEHYLRTGQRFTAAEWSEREQKYNHNHDELGRFTFSNAGIGSTPHSGRRLRATGLKPKSSTGNVSSRPNQAHVSSRRSASGQGLASPQTVSPASSHRFTQIGTHPARAYVTKNGMAIIDPRSGTSMLVPQGVSIGNTIRVARMFGSPLNRHAAATAAFGPGRLMDFQRTHSTLRDSYGNVLIDQRFIAIGNYNFGVYAAASGMSLSEAFSGARAVYLLQTLRSSRNARNESLILSGYRDFQNGNVGN